jgi:Arm DNA-binding domain
LLVTPEGGRYWRLKYRFAGRERGFGVGVYMDAATREVRVSLALARERREKARQLLARGRRSATRAMISTGRSRRCQRAAGLQSLIRGV